MTHSQEYAKGQRGQDKDLADEMQVFGMGENCNVRVSDINQLTREQGPSQGNVNPNRGTWGNSGPHPYEREPRNGGITNNARSMQVVGMGDHSQVQIGYSNAPSLPSYMSPGFQGNNYSNFTHPPFSSAPPRFQGHFPLHQFMTSLYQPPFLPAPPPVDCWASSAAYRQQTPTPTPDVRPPPSQYGAAAPYPPTAVPCIPAPAASAPYPPTPASKSVPTVDASVSVAPKKLSKQAPSVAPPSSVTSVTAEAVAISEPAASRAVAPSSAPPLTNQALPSPAAEPVPATSHRTVANHDSNGLVVPHPQLNTAESSVSELNAPSCTTNTTPSTTEQLKDEVTEKALSATPGAPENSHDDVPPAPQSRAKKFCRLVIWIIGRFKKQPKNK